MKNWLCVLSALLPVAALANVPYEYKQSENSPNYLLRLPAGYATSTERYPLLMFLHGVGEKGNGSEKAIEKVAVHGPFRSMLEGTWDASLPLIVAGPQFGGLRPWWPRDKVIAVMDHLVSSYRVDPDRVYLTGLSIGGAAAWSIAETVPRRVAAIVPAGAWSGDLRQECGELDHLGVWAFHGERDRLIWLRRGRKPVDMINGCELPPRAPAHLTVLADTSHGHWEVVYDNRHGDRNIGGDGREYTDIYRWLLTFSLEHAP
jgi:predicted peptidase